MKKNRLFEERKRKVSEKAKELVDSAFKRIDEEHELLTDKNLPKEDLFQSISKTTNMKKEFTVNQLIQIQNIFTERCENCINIGMRGKAAEYLEIINVVLSNIGWDEYKDLDEFSLNKIENVSYEEKRDLEAISEMIAFARSYENKPSDRLKKIVNEYLENFPANNGISRIDTVERRKLAIQRLIVLCIHACTSEELKRLDGIVKELAENF